MVVIAVILLALFVKAEHRAVDPILAPHLIRNKTVIKGAVYMFIFGIGMVGAMMYTNLLVISVFGLSTLDAGIWSLAMVAGMMITSMSSGALLYRTGFRVWLIAGPILCFLGLYYLSGMAVSESMLNIIPPTGSSSISDISSIVDASQVRDAYMCRYLVGIFVLGLGLGCMMAVVMSAVQNSSKQSEMGMTTSAVNLFRSIGCTMGTAIFSMIINSRISTELLDRVPEIYDLIPHTTDVLDKDTFAIPGVFDHLDGILVAMSNSVDFAFIVGGVIILLLVFVGVVFKGEKPPVDEGFEAAKKEIESGN